MIELTDGGVDKAFEAIGNGKTSDQIIQATRPGGTATIIGGLGSGPFTISSGNFVTKEITITGVSSRQANDVDEVFQMAQQGRIELKKLLRRATAMSRSTKPWRFRAWQVKDGGFVVELINH